MLGEENEYLASRVKNDVLINSIGFLRLPYPCLIERVYFEKLSHISIMIAMINLHCESNK